MCTISIQESNLEQDVISMITLGNNNFAVWDISPDSTLLGVTDTWMTSLFAQSGPVFPQLRVFDVILTFMEKIFINFFTRSAPFIVLKMTVLNPRFQRKNRFEKRTTLGWDICKNVFQHGMPLVVGENNFWPKNIWWTEILVNNDFWSTLLKLELEINFPGWVNWDCKNRALSWLIFRT